MLDVWKRYEEAEEWRDVVMSILALVDHYYELGEFGRAVELIREGIDHVRRHPMPDLEASLNLRLGARILEDGRFIVGTTRFRGRVAFRPTMVNWRTEPEHLHAFVGVVRDLGAELLAHAR